VNYRLHAAIQSGNVAYNARLGRSVRPVGQSCNFIVLGVILDR